MQGLLPDGGCLVLEGGSVAGRRQAVERAQERLRAAGCTVHRIAGHRGPWTALEALAEAARLLRGAPADGEHGPADGADGGADADPAPPSSIAARTRALVALLEDSSAPAALIFEDVDRDGARDYSFRPAFGALARQSKRPVVVTYEPALGQWPVRRDVLVLPDSTLDPASFTAGAPEPVQRAAWLLATSIALRPAELAALLVELWPETDAQDAISQLASWPFVEPADDGWRVAPSCAVALTDEFRRSDHISWWGAHHLLVALEESAKAELTTPDDPGIWAIDARIAYYLSVPDPTESARLFGEALGDPPHANPDGASRWLVSLARRASEHFASRPRERSFFTGMDIFTSATPAAALEHLVPVYKKPTHDPYTAASLYMAGVIQSAIDVDDAMALLESAVALSEELHLVDTELRARHSLVWTLFRRITRESMESTMRRRVLEEASELTHRNQFRAEQHGSALLIARAGWSTAVADWLLLVDRRPEDMERLTVKGLEAVEQLARARTELFASGDARAALLTTKDAMSILRDLGRLDEAIELGDAAIDMARWVETRTTLRIIERTVKGLLELADDYQRESIESLLGEIGALTRG